MKALRIERPGEAKVVDIPEPSLGPEEVLVEIRRAGFCGSDLSTFRGTNPLVSYPRIPGHELAVTVLAAGAHVPAEWSTPGRDALVIPYSACGECSACRIGRQNACRHNQTLGVQRDGGLRERMAVHWSKLMAADGLSHAALAMVEPLTIGFHAVARGRVTSADTVLVLGCGAIGLGAVAAVARAGARVLAADLDRRKLEVAMAAGAADGIDSSTEPLGDRLRELTGGHGPEVVIEAVGTPATFLAAVNEVAFAGRVVYIGYAREPVAYETKLFVQKELDILGSRNATPTDFRAVCQLLAGGRFPLAQAITKVVSLEEAQAALADWQTHPGDFLKIQVAFG